MKTKKFKIVCLSVAAVLIALIIAVNIAYNIFEPMIVMLFSTTEMSEESRAGGEKLATQIEEEGIVMVKNDADENGNATLPLNKGTVDKVNVFGWSATQWIMSGSGSGRSTNANGSLMPDTDLLKALTNYGIEYNTKLIDMYTGYLNSRPFWSTGSLGTHEYQFCRLFEPKIDDKTKYTDALLSEALGYSDTALVVLGRVSGESIDCPTVQYKNSTAQAKPTDNDVDETRTYLDISTEEEALLTYVGANYANVIVIINSTNAMNLGFLDSNSGIKGLDACLIVGGTGNNAANAIPNVLFGEKEVDILDAEGNPTGDKETVEVSPSGRTTDTYVYNFHTNASFAYTGLNGTIQYAGVTSADRLYPLTTTNPNVSAYDDKYPGLSYLDYIEGIYVGYKWYETADAENFWTSSFAKQQWGVNGYDDVVQYPFGYGLTYTNFQWGAREWKVNEDEGTITVTVQVKNNGNFPAQEVVELYFTPENYKKGGIEKAAVNLCAFAKTPTAVQPGATQELTLTFDIFDMASYDSSEIKVNGGGYILESGDYTISLRTDAHTVAEVPLGGSATYRYHVSSDIKYDKDPVTGKPVHNLFTGDDCTDPVPVDTGENVDWLSRSDFEKTFHTEKDAARTITQAIKDNNLFTAAAAQAWLEKQGNVAMPKTGEKNGVTIFSGKLPNEEGINYGNPENYNNNEMWDKLLNQLTLDEMKELANHAYAHEKKLESIGKTQQSASVDGPAQIGSFTSGKGVGYSNPTVIAQTWNVQLAKSFGIAVGTQTKGTNREGWYAPGVNIHRSAFGGRNYEYYSEDAFLSGQMCAATVRGALNVGVYTYIKHFIGYDQESYRDSLYCWMTEQALREIYLKPYKMAIDEGATGLMTSYGRLGAVWSGGSEALLTDLLRNEWDFKGAVITDYADHHEFMSGDHMLRAGGDLWMDGASTGSFKMETNSAAIVQRLRDAAKHVIYMECNAAYEKANYDPSADGISVINASNDGVFPWWSACLIAFNIVFAVGAAALVGLAVYSFILSAKDKNGTASEETTQE